MSVKKREKSKKEFRLLREAQKVDERRSMKKMSAMMPKGKTIKGSIGGKWTRHFLGKTEGFANKYEQRKEQKHLKAYLRGDSTYTFGKDSNGYPEVHPVMAELKRIA